MTSGARRAAETGTADRIYEDAMVLVDRAELHTLRQQLADKDAEIERYKQSPTVETCRKMIEEQAVVENAELHRQLATAEKQIVMLHDFIEEVANSTPSDDADGTPMAAWEFLQEFDKELK